MHFKCCIKLSYFKWHCGGCLTYTSAEQSSAVKHPPKQTHFNSDKKVNSKPSGSGRSPLNRFANRPVKPQSAFFEFCSFLVSEFFSLRYCFGRRVFYVVLFCFLTSQTCTFLLHECAGIHLFIMVFLCCFLKTHFIFLIQTKAVVIKS